MRETELDLATLGQTESVFALSNGHIGLRGNLDEGEPYGSARHLPERLLRGRPLPYAEAGYGYPEAGETVVNVTNGKIIRLLVDDEPFDVRYGELLSHERVLDLRDGMLRRAMRLALADRVARCGSSRRGSSRSRSARSRRSATRSSRSSETTLVRRPVRAGRQRAAAAAATDDPRAAAALDSAAALRRVRSLREDAGACWSTAPRAAACAWPPAMDHVIEGPDGTRIDAVETCGRSGAAHGRRPSSGPGQTLRLVKFLAYGWSAQRSMPAIARPGRRRRRRGPAHRLGRAGQRPARVTSTTSGSAPTSSSTATPSCSRRCASRSSTASRPAPARERRAIPRQGPDRLRLRRPRLLGHRDLRAAGPDLHRPPAPPRDALRWRHATLDVARERAQQLGLEGAAFPWRTIDGAGVLRLLAGRAPPPSTSTPTSPTPSSATRTATGDDGVRTRASASSSWSRPPGCGARSATTTRAGASASTASPDPTSTARSPTTTSTPT